MTLLPAFLSLLFGAAALVLLVACANATGLLLARALDRRREMALHLALGATRGHIVRLLLGESVLLAGLAAACAVALTMWAAAAVRTWQPPIGIPVALPIAVDGRVFAFAAAVALEAALIAGLVPALQGSRIDPLEALKTGGSSTVSGRSRLRRCPVVRGSSGAAAVSSRRRQLRSRTQGHLG